MAAALPECGLYRTGIALAAGEEQVPAGCLVLFHNHSDQDVPMVATPHANEHNRWQFHARGWPVRDQAFLDALISLKPEGYYINTHHLHVTKEEIIPENTLLQLGYNRTGDTILFVARFEGNTITFPTQGYGLKAPDLQQHLEPVAFNVPKIRSADSLH